MRRFALLPAFLLLSACNGISIDSFPNEGTVVPDEEGRVSVVVSSFGWEIAAPGECGDRAQCGHLVARLTADEQLDEHTWNGTVCGEGDLEIEGTTFTIDLKTCERQTGWFTLLVHLHDDDHAYYEGGGVADIHRFIVAD